jgi:hypothetical protein
VKVDLRKAAALMFCGVLFGVLPGCMEVWLLNLATPFLLNR